MSQSVGSENENTTLIGGGSIINADNTMSVPHILAMVLYMLIATNCITGAVVGSLTYHLTAQHCEVVELRAAIAEQPLIIMP